MTEATRPLRHILVALDASPHSREALEMAVGLAVAFEAEVQGLFVRDRNLLRAARLPFAQEVRAHTRDPKRLTDRRMERQLRYQAERAEAALQEAGERAGVPYNFRVSEGNVTSELLDATDEADLIAIGKASTKSSRRRLGTTCAALLSKASTPVLVLRKAAQHHQPVLTYYDGSETAARALKLAAQIAARVAEHPLKVLLPTEDEEETNRLRQEVRELFGDRLPQLQVRPLTDIERARLAALARQEGAGLLVMPGGCTPLESTPLQRFLYESDRPLLVVR